jgi:hypothetical protein
VIAAPLATPAVPITPIAGRINDTVPRLSLRRCNVIKPTNHEQHRDGRHLFLVRLLDRKVGAYPVL